MNFLAGSFRVGRLFDIEIRVHMLFVIWVAFRVIQGGAGLSDLYFIGLLFGIVLIHEFGHCFGARAVGGDARHILMWPLGGLAFAHAPMTPWAQFVTVVCGPLVNVAFCVVSGLLLIAASGTVTVLSPNPFNSVHLPYGVAPWMWYVGLFYFVNYWLLALNLLPVYPLDGGQLLQCLLWPFLGLQRALDLACKVGIGGCIFFGIWGVQAGEPILFFIALFGGFTCWQRLQALRYGLVIDERMYAPPPRPRSGGGFWRRVLGRRSRPAATSNPNPGGWERKIEQERTLEEEVDRILAKVHREGIQSLSYTERQTLERASRERQRREREFQQQRRL